MSRLFISHSSLDQKDADDIKSGDEPGTPLAAGGLDRLEGGAGNDLIYGGKEQDLLWGDGQTGFGGGPTSGTGCRGRAAL